MSTRSHIGIKEGNAINYIYCHFDGYLENNGIILVKEYGHDVEKLKKLINKGGCINSLTANPDLCDYDVEFSTMSANNLEQFSEQEFNYYYDVDKHKWFVVLGKNETPYTRKNLPDKCIRYDLEKLLHSPETLKTLFKGFYIDSFLEEFVNTCNI